MTATSPGDKQAPRGLGRRGFLGTLGAALVAAGSEACRRGVERIVPYSAMPEHVIPGIPAHYASVYGRRGDALGLVVESHEGRPTKIEGNPLHPSSLGGADLIAQASILDLYDPERSTTALKGGAPATREAIETELRARLAEHVKDGGARLRVLTEPLHSPTAVRLRATILARFPKARVHAYGSLGSEARAGADLAYGEPLHALCAHDRSRVTLALDADFLQTEPGSVRAQKLFAKARKATSPNDPMNRLYVVESLLTTTGAHADHRLRLSPTRIELYALTLAAELVRQGVALGALEPVVAKRARVEEFPPQWIVAVARDLVANRTQSLVVVGSGQPKEVHALAHAINDALGNVGATLELVPVIDPERRDDAEDLRALTSALASGAVDTLVMIGGNPAYDAPADLAFAAALSTVAFSLHLAHFVDETSARCSIHVPRAHELEAWGDQRALDGTIAVQQPLIAPLFGGTSDLELLALLADLPPSKGDELVAATLADALLTPMGVHACAPPAGGRMACRDAQQAAIKVAASVGPHAWRKALRDGVLPRMIAPPKAHTLLAAEIATALAARGDASAASPENLAVVFAADAKMLDGRHANNSWLQELPDPITAIVWDNAALISPATSRALSVESGDVVRLTRGGRSVDVAAFVQPGVADHTIALFLGWGRTRAGRIGNGRGFDVHPLRTTDTMHFSTGVRLVKTGAHHALVRTQEHPSMEHRPIAREGTLAEYKAEPHFAETRAVPKRSLPLWGTDPDYSHGHQWGMSIDLNACTGCNACVVACQAENNVPVVGKEEVAKGREMYWLRLDHYLVDDEEGATPDDPRFAFQPLACVQCEAAPCENVCPVEATVHSPEGLSEVVYNRCIGTRYCANNCPYKVRRFNYLNWHNDGVWKETGRLPETLQMQQNPNVTVRFRGVVEKCTYCVQRIEGRRIDAKRDQRAMRDGDVVVACQQTCPADAITFGDLNDPNSRVSLASMGERRYAVLEELGTKPRTTHLAKIRNLNPEMK